MDLIGAKQGESDNFNHVIQRQPDLKKNSPFDVSLAQLYHHMVSMHSLSFKSQFLSVTDYITCNYKTRESCAPLVI